MSHIPNQNNNLQVATLGGDQLDQLEFTPIVAWTLMRIDYPNAGDGVNYVDPVTIIPVDNRAVMDISTGKWWYGTEVSGTGAESLLDCLKECL